MAEVDKVFQEAYFDNEADANKYMSYVNAATAIISLVLWIMYLTKVFTIPDHFLPFVLILFPVASLILILPMFFIKTNLLRKHWYKYFIMFSLTAVIMAINIAVPKHGLLLWPFTLLLANHYYNPKIGTIIYIVTMVAMLLCMYMGMFFGEYDQNLLGSGIISNGEIILPDTFEERVQMLNALRAAGDNRYVKVLIYYYAPRAAALSLFFMVTNLLNKRAYKLLDNEIKIHDEQEKSKTELEVAKGIQLNTLPEEFTASKEVEIIGELKAAKEVGGDFYDYLDIDENHVAIIIGDVSGKGVPAAMFMMKTITSFRDFATANKTPSQILKEVNSSIHRGNVSNMFVTCFLAILDKRDGKLIYANAGHNKPVVGHNRAYRFLECQSGFLLGGFKDAFITDEEIVLQPEDCITLYTDGITEARNNNKEFFGEARLLNTFNKTDYTSIVEIHRELKEEVANFVLDAPQSDDITFVTLKYRGSTYSNVEKVFDAKNENIAGMLAFINEFGESHCFPKPFLNKLAIVGDEIISNIVHHGYQNNGGEILIRLSFNDETKDFVLTVIDEAIEFNQLDVEDKAYEKDSKIEKVGGLGILIVKTIMDEYAYDHINGKNILVLKKKL